MTRHIRAIELQKKYVTYLKCFTLIVRMNNTKYFIALKQDIT